MPVCMLHPYRKYLLPLGIPTIIFANKYDVFRDVESGTCHYGVVPVENSTEGVISHTLDMFMRSPL